MQVDLNGKKLWLNLHHLYYFYVIVNEGSLTKASETLLVGPPSLSSQLKQLEANLGTDLFERKNKKLIMTAKGQTVYSFAETIFRTGQDLVDALHPQDKVYKTQIRVGIPESISKNIVLNLCRKVINDQSHVINIRSGKTNELLRDLKDRSLDVLFVNQPPVGSDTQGVSAKKISSSPLVICGHERHRTFGSRFPESLRAAPFMLSLPESRIRSSIDQYFKKNGIKVELIGETKDSSMQRIIATQGLALIVAPLSSVQDLLESKELIEIGRPQGLSEDLYVLSSSWAEETVTKKILTELHQEHLL